MNTVTSQTNEYENAVVATQCFPTYQSRSAIFRELSEWVVLVQDKEQSLKKFVSSLKIPLYLKRGSKQSQDKKSVAIQIDTSSIVQNGIM